MNKIFFALLLLGGSMGSVSALAQAPVAPLPSFEVASVKPSEPDSHRIQMMFGYDKISTRNTPLKMLIQFAYGLKSDDQLSGLPGSLASKGFDIEAKQGEDEVAAIKKLPEEERSKMARLMLQSLLAERFKLKATQQTRELPIYALVVAKGGVKMKAADEPSVVPVATESTPAKPRGRMMMSGRGQVTGDEVAINVLTDVLSRQPETQGRVVVDKTGLTGKYSFELKWTPESGAPLAGGPGGGGPPVDDSGPSFFTAIQEELGLKLESQKGPVDVLVVEHVEEPSAN